MKLSKNLVLSLMLGTTFATSSIYADTSSLTAKEMSTLATIATIDSSEILISTVASHKTQDNGVMNLANMMISQHGSNLTQILSMPQQSEKLTIALSHGTAEKLALETNNDLATLGALQGTQFDHAFVDAMVTGHEGALKLIDTQLMKTATSEEMKKFVADTRVVVANHLAAAQALQKKMGA